MQLYFATGNPHKVQEVREALPDNVTIEQLSVDIYEIDAADVADVARQKVLDSHKDSQPDGPVIVDDTGLYIDALNGFPGSHASFFFERCGYEGILTLMKGKNNRTASFRTALAIYQPDEDRITILEGECNGRIARNARGDDGFGYDPIFLPKGHDRTFAEDTDHKLQVSHRTQVIEKLGDWVTDR